MKTNKLPEVIRMHLGQGITKFKCATIAEAEMIAACEAPDVLMAYQPVGPNVERFVELVKHFPGTAFSALADDADTIRELSRAAVGAGVTLSLFLDLDVGMHRTGVAAGPEAVERYRLISTLPGLRAAGLHAYDGHLHETDLPTRDQAVRRGLRLGSARAGRPRNGRIARSFGRRRRHADFPDSCAAPGRRVQSGNVRFLGLELQHDPAGPRFPACRPPPHAHREQARRKPSVPGSRPQGGRVREPAASRDPPGAAGNDGRRPQRGTPRARNGSSRRVFSRFAFLWHAVAHLSRRWRSTTRPWSSRAGGRSGDGRSSAARGRSAFEPGVRPGSDPGHPGSYAFMALSAATLAFVSSMLCSTK